MRILAETPRFNQWVFTFAGLLVVLAALGRTVAIHAEPPQNIALNDPLPYGTPVIDYFAETTDDAVAQWNSKANAKAIALESHPSRGYLDGLLNALDVPISSQMLVFTKTALNPRLVSPQTPRAIYFNDDVSVGWVSGAESLEIATVDSKRGVIFYTLSQPKDDADRSLVFRREQRCLACHAGSATLKVPGGVIKSFRPDEIGKPISGYSRVTHELEFHKRFGGWYVTGKHADAEHRGNVFGEVQNTIDRMNMTDLDTLVDTSPYPSRHSDIVAQLVFHHQMHGWNLLIRAGMESRLNRRSTVEDDLLRYLLFIDEAPLTAAVSGTSSFTREFSNRGPKDSQGRSLRQFDLKTRLFRYRLSYLVYSQAFKGLPRPVRGRLATRFAHILTTPDCPPPFDQIPFEERSAIWEILCDTKPKFVALRKKADKSSGSLDARREPNSKGAPKSKF
ncbi:hypothetical protein [Thalassoroseus pseudoceratinae]|uniref:hypothetical protein n=1 Tax=Thalassoroseus pseudoceratinae TaxID=2713176 RepID=UPI00141F69A8|nr:hypothetical protein [Thalassoroseus pseudoceratinae]